MITNELTYKTETDSQTQKTKANREQGVWCQQIQTTIYTLDKEQVPLHMMENYIQYLVINDNEK